MSFSHVKVVGVCVEGVAGQVGSSREGYGAACVQRAKGKSTKRTNVVAMCRTGHKAQGRQEPGR